MTPFFLPSLLPASMAGYSDPLGSQTSPAQMMDPGQMEAFSGILPHCISTDAGTTTMMIGALLIIITQFHL